MWCYSVVQMEEFQHLNDDTKAVHFSIYPNETKGRESSLVSFDA